MIKLRPMDGEKTQPVTFQAQGLALEGVLHIPAYALRTPVPGAVMCHPHPLYGGDMHNNVVVAVCRALAARGFAALRFNFRPARGSEGPHGSGRDEQADVITALDFLASQPGIDARRLCLAGYSFGATVALTTPYPAVAALAAVSPPLSATLQLRLACPTLFLFGERDSIAPAAALERSGIELPPASGVTVIPDADHFWWGYEGEVAQAVVAFFAERMRG
jgi:alpha/beta superfamily hydrolase